MSFETHAVFCTVSFYLLEEIICHEIPNWVKKCSSQELDPERLWFKYWGSLSYNNPWRYYCLHCEFILHHLILSAKFRQRLNSSIFSFFYDFILSGSCNWAVKFYNSTLIFVCNFVCIFARKLIVIHLKNFPAVSEKSWRLNHSLAYLLLIKQLSLLQKY